MKKEKKVRTYQRRTKSGKTITVRAHTASYEAAEKAKEAAKKKGAGDEISERKKKNWELPMDEFLKKMKEERLQKRDDEEETKKVEDKKPKKKSEKKTEKKSPAKKNTVGTGTNGQESKKKTTTKKMVAKAEASEPAFTKDEFKEWYRGTGSAADKKVAKALRKQLGRSGYRKFEDEAIDNYTSRGHLSMFKRVSGGSSSSVKTKSADASTKVTKDKVSTPKKEKQSAEVKKEFAHQKSYVQHILKLSSKDPAMKSYIAAESKILSDLKSYNGPIKTGSEIMDSEKALTKKHGLIYDGDGEYRDRKSGKMYRVSTSPITGISTLHPLTGYLSGATTKQLRQAGFKGKDESTIDYDKLRKIIWGGTKGKKDSTPKVSKPTLSKKVSKQITPEQLKKEAAMGSTSTKLAFNIGGATYGKSEYDLFRKGGKEYAVNRKTGKLATDSMTAKIMAFHKKVSKDNKDGVAVKYKKRSVGTGTNGPELKNQKQLI